MFEFSHWPLFAPKIMNTGKVQSTMGSVCHQQRRRPSALATLHEGDLHRGSPSRTYSM